jgi:hypothetical protein
VTFTQRNFVPQLDKKSEMIEEINQAFLDRSLSLELFSFYESTEMRGIGVTYRNSTLTMLGDSTQTLSYLGGSQ